MEFGTDLIERGVGIDHASNAIVDELARRGAPATLPRIEGGQDYTDPALRRGWMAEALAARSSPHFKASEPARQFASHRIGDFARECLALRGGESAYLPGLNSIKAALTTSDFPLLLADVAHKTLMAEYQAAPAGVLAICRRADAVDFRTKHNLKFGEGPTLLQTSETGEFQYGSISEGDETYALARYGRILSISYKALVNDDTSAFSRVPRMLALAARELEAQTVVDLLTSNAGGGPTMSDGNPLFHSAHGNLAGAGAAIDVSPVGAARAAMRLQKGLSGKPVNIVPMFLLVNAAKETLGEQVLSSVYSAKVSDVNPFSERLKLVVDPRLDAKSGTAWYVAADLPQTAIEYCYLTGEEGPQVATRTGFTTDGIDLRVTHNFGAGAVDFRGIYRNPGA